jgi:hypothetical protein
MICKNCNNTIPDDAAFCTFCGQKVESQTTSNNSAELEQQKVDESKTVMPETENCSASEKSEESKNNVEISSENLNSEEKATEPSNDEKGNEEQPVKKKSKKKKIIIASVCVAVAIAIIATVLVIVLGGKDDGNFVYPKNTYTAMATSYSALSSSLTAEIYSGDKSVATFDDAKAVTASINGLFYINSSDELYYFDGKNNQKIAEEVFKIIKVSPNGGFVYYCATVNDERSYCRYDVNKKNSQVLFAEDTGTISQFCVSENGKYAAYAISTYDSDTYETVYNSYVYNGSVISRIDEEGFIPLSISNDGKSMYGYCREDYKTNIVSIVNGEKTKVCQGVTELNSGLVVLNYAQNSLVCYSDGYVYISVNYKKAEKIFKSTSSNIRPCMPEDAKYIKDFKNTFWKAGNSLVYLDGAFKDYSVDKNVYVYRLLKNGTLFYTDDNYSLYKVTAGTINNPEKIATKVDKFYPTDNGDKVYYINNSDTAYVYSKGEKTEILEDVNNIVVSAKGEAILFAEYSNSVGELYYCKGTKCDKIDSDVSSVTRIGNSIWYLSDYDSDENCYNAYIQKSGKEFKKVKEEIYMIGNSNDD